MTITMPTFEQSKPIERFVLQISIKYQVIALKALHLYQSWTGDSGMFYQENAINMYGKLESVIVNSQLPSSYERSLIPKQELENQVNSD